MFRFVVIDNNEIIKRDVGIEIVEDLYYQKIKYHDTKDRKDEFKKEMARVEEKIPLYDVYSENIYLITKFNVYNRVIKQHYRFPNRTLLNSIKNKKIDEKDPLKNRVEKKRKLMLDFMENYDLEVLENTYIKLFYRYSEQVGKNLTNCKRPSFIKYLRHLQPYYTRSELINTALNMGLIKPNKEYYDEEKIEKLCPEIVSNDINKHVIMNHHKHILDTKKMGILQYYSLQGSYFINQYLRDQTRYRSRNLYIEKLIKTMKDTVNSAPEFDKEYIVYRFVQDDSYLVDLDIGDIFADRGFMSTTRDPFYNSDEFKFGFILIKIHLPKNKKGVGLCVETVSHFPKEQEIILPPGTKLKLIKKDTECDYYHTSMSFATKVIRRYEFKIVGKEEIKSDRKDIFSPKSVDFLKEHHIGSFVFDEKISRFVKQFCGEQYRYKTLIGDKEYEIVVEWYDSSSVYSDFYYVKTSDGVCMYSINQDNMSFFLEFTQQILYVNYYFQHSLTDRDNQIDNKDFLVFISSVAHYFDIPKVIIFTNYEIGEYSYGLGNYCTDFYEYLTEGKERFSEREISIKPRFRYYLLDIMKDIKIGDILRKSDTDELYQIHKKLYDGKDNFRDFYLWIVKNFSYLTQILVSKTSRVYAEDNPFEHDYYVLDPYGYLYRNRLTNTYREAIVLSNPEIRPKNIYRVATDIPRAPTNRIT